MKHYYRSLTAVLLVLLILMSNFDSSARSKRRCERLRKKAEKVCDCKFTNPAEKSEKGARTKKSQKRNGRQTTYVPGVGYTTTEMYYDVDSTFEPPVVTDSGMLVTILHPNGDTTSMDITDGDTTTTVMTSTFTVSHNGDTTWRKMYTEEPSPSDTTTTNEGTVAIYRDSFGVGFIAMPPKKFQRDNSTKSNSPEFILKVFNSFPEITTVEIKRTATATPGHFNYWIVVEGTSWDYRLLSQQILMECRLKNGAPPG